MLKQKSRSLSILNLQNSIKQTHRTQRRHSNFVPFCSERRNGKLIVEKGNSQSNTQQSTEQLLKRINFKNFKQIYKQISRNEHARYSSMTRKSSQEDLINPQLWKKKSAAKLKVPKYESTRHKNYQSLKADCLPPENVKFDKSNLQLYKKLSIVPKPDGNEQLQSIYANYIRICELNQNIRRNELIGKVHF